MTFVPAKSNPFTITRVHAIPFQFAAGQWNDHLVRLHDMNWRGAIIGRRGSGKSTLLRQLHERLESSKKPSRLIKVPNRGNNSLILERALNQRQSHILLIDGMERLSLRDRWRIRRETRGNAGLVVVRHYRSSLPTWMTCSTDHQLMRAVLARLGFESERVNLIACKLFDQYRGNIRLVLRELYNQFSEGKIDVDSNYRGSPVTSQISYSQG